jgi:hypothetical protein
MKAHLVAVLVSLELMNCGCQKSGAPVTESVENGAQLSPPGAQIARINSVGTEQLKSLVAQTNSYYLVALNMPYPITDYVYKKVGDKSVSGAGHFDPPITQTCTYSDPKQCAMEHKWRQVALIPCDADLELTLWSVSEHSPKWFAEIDFHNKCSYAYYWDWVDQKAEPK